MDQSDVRKASRLVRLLNGISSPSSEKIPEELDISFCEYVTSSKDKLKSEQEKVSSSSEYQHAMKSLKQHYFVFVRKCLTILLTHMRNVSSIPHENQQSDICQSNIHQLMTIYLCCLLLLDNVSFEASKSYYACQIRSTFLKYLQEWGDYKDVVKHAMRILTNIQDMVQYGRFECGKIEKLEKIVINAVYQFLISLRKQERGLNIEDNDFKSFMKNWVQSLCKVSYINNEYELPTWDKFSEFSTDKFPISQILEMEILEYQSLEFKYPVVATKMQLAIIHILRKPEYYRRLKVVQRFRLWVRNWRMIQYAHKENTSQTIGHLTTAIEIGVNADFKRRGTLLCHELAVAYSLRALANREEHQDKINASDDIGHALELWMRMKVDTKESINSVQKSSLCHDPLILLCYITDLLALKSCTEFDRSIFKLLIKFGNWRTFPVKEFIQFLWGSRRLGHALCISPINDDLLGELCFEDEKLTTIKFWMGCLEDSKSLIVGLKQKLYESSECFSSFELDTTIEGLKKTCPELKQLGDIRSNFSAGHLYFDLCERLIASGQLYEAIVCGTEAFKLRKRIYGSYFSASHKLKDDVSRVIWSPQTKNDNYISPWKVIQCFLESCLQIGTVWEMIGDDKQAKKSLLLGKEVADQMNLPLFRVSFSCVLGKLYHGQQLFKLSQEELESAAKILAHTSSDKACPKCKLVLKVSVDLERGDLTRSNLGSKNKDASYESSSSAETFYSSTLKKLEPEEWKNIFGYSSNSGISTCIHKERNCCILLKDAINMKWEMSRRRLYVRSLEGMCQGIQNNMETQQDILEKSLAMLFKGNTDQLCISENPMLIKKIISSFGSIFALEIATVLYNLSWTHFKRNTNVIRSIGQQSSSQLNDLSVRVTWLKHASTLCREVPNLFIKVSRLLSVVYILGPWKELSCLSRGTDVSESRWAAYFHASSIGAHSHHMFSSASGSSIIGSTSKKLEPFNLERFEEEFEKSNIEFFAKLPSCVTVCVSLIGQPLTKLLEDILEYDTPKHAWLLVSRLKYGKEPLVALLPVHSILEVPINDRTVCFSTSDSSRIWKPRWGLTLVDEVAPLYKHILLEDSVVRRALSQKRLKRQERLYGLEHRKRLNGELEAFLMKLEEEWFGPWLIVLCAELSNSPDMDGVESVLMGDLEGYNITVNALLLKALLGARGRLSAEQCIDQLLSVKKGCIIGKPRSRGNEHIASISDAVKSQIRPAITCMGDALEKIKVLTESKMGREPMVFMPDLEVQMLPWESTPRLGEQEMYRVPNVCSIGWILKKNNGTSACRAPFTWIDPLDVICVEDHRFKDAANSPLRNTIYEGSITRKLMEVKPVKPGSDDEKTKIGTPDDGDKKTKKIKIENSDDGNEKKIENSEDGNEKKIEIEIPDLTSDLKKHNLFVYFGHGGDLNKLVDKHLNKIDTWPACILMGCETGALSYTGSYGPSGNPLRLLKEGSPVVLSSLWTLIFGDMESYVQSVLDDLIIEGNRQKEPGFDPRRMFASPMKQGRLACRYSHSTGAAMVCYGLPTGVLSKQLKEMTLPVKVEKTFNREKDSSKDDMEMGVEV